jgi:protease-4
MIVLGTGMKHSQQIGVIEMDGPIGPKIKATEYVKLFRSIEGNDNVKAVVLDIDSPGGSATGSDYMHIAISSLAKRKPVVAFIRGVGASGAYLISCPASRIIAIPSALIGSIGVMSIRPLLYDSMERLGLKVSVTKSDRLKDMGSMFREPTPEEQAKEQELVDELYDMFLDSVAQGRNMDKAKVKEVATGEVYTARKAKDLGLVDELGDLERAIDVAAELSGAPRKPVWLKPKKGLRELVSSMVAGAFADELVSRFEERFTSRFYYQSKL